MSEPRFTVEGFGGGDYAGVYDRKHEVDVSEYTEHKFTRGQLERIAAELNAKYTQQPAPPPQDGVEELRAALLKIRDLIFGRGFFDANTLIDKALLKRIDEIAKDVLLPPNAKPARDRN